ncbi:MAG: glycosyltransferase family 2 protein [Pirellulales bacterium]|nr:glycosyltransferase family 2 protein [Pirellulales bacterium]
MTAAPHSSESHVSAAAEPAPSPDGRARPRYSIVIPVYRSAPLLPKLVERLDAFFAQHPYSHEYIFVNDGSPDESWQVLERLKQGRDELVIIDLLRNYGQHSAVFCGLQQSRGDWVITMDDDLQNPPEELIHLIRKADEGADAVFGQFHQKMHGTFRLLGSKLVGWLNYKLFNKPKTLVLTNFRCLRREVVDAMCQVNTTFPYIPGLVLLSAKTFANVPVAHHARPVGTSNYNLSTIARLVWRIVFNYSSFPLRLLCGIGLATSLFSFLLGAFFLIRSFFVKTQTPGWPSLVVLMSFYQGIVLIIFAAVGEYLVRIVNDVSGQKSYRIRKRL